MKITIDTAEKTIEVHGRASAEDMQRFLYLLADDSHWADLSEWAIKGTYQNGSATTATPVPHYLSTPIPPHSTTGDPLHKITFTNSNT